MHPNLFVFRDLEAAEAWVMKWKGLLHQYRVSVRIVSNGNEKQPEGCSILFGK